MMASDHIITVTEADFEYEVIAFSRQTPVVVDFWAEWCGPCKMLGPLLEKLADEAQGSFRLAKVDVDSSPNLALRFGVRSIPNVKAFRDGQVVAEFVGAQPEPRVRLCARWLPSQTDLPEKPQPTGYRKLEGGKLLPPVPGEKPRLSGRLVGAAKKPLDAGLPG
jgi:thioredoxin